MTGQGLGPVLSRLLGPGVAEVTCEACFDELDRYVDLELGGGDAEAAVPGMRAHLSGCPACAEEHEDLQALAGHHLAEHDPGRRRTSHDPRHDPRDEQRPG